VIGGSRATHTRPPATPAIPLIGYAADSTLDELVTDYKLQRSSIGSLILWSVEDLATIPRQGRAASVVVGAVDVLDTDPSGDQTAATRILQLALQAHRAYTLQPDPPPQGSYADRRPYVAVDDLSSLTGPTSGIVELPLWLDWGPERTYDVSDTRSQQVMYETVLREAQRAADLQQFLDAATLIHTWPRLRLPAQIRAIWEDRFPNLASRTAEVDQEGRSAADPGL